MCRRPTRSTRTAPLFPYTTLFRSRPVVAAVFFGLLRELLRRRAQYFEVTHRRIGGAFMGVDLAEPIGGLLAEERAVGMVLGAVGAGEPSQIIGFSLGQEGGGQDRGGFTGLEAVAGDPFLADARLLPEHDAGLLVVPSALSGLHSDPGVTPP